MEERLPDLEPVWLIAGLVDQTDDREGNRKRGEGTRRSRRRGIMATGHDAVVVVVVVLIILLGQKVRRYLFCLCWTKRVHTGFVFPPCFLVSLHPMSRHFSLLAYQAGFDRSTSLSTLNSWRSTPNPAKGCINGLLSNKYNKWEWGKRRLGQKPPKHFLLRMIMLWAYHLISDVAQPRCVCDDSPFPAIGMVMKRTDHLSFLSPKKMKTRRQSKEWKERKK